MNMDRQTLLAAVLLCGALCSQARAQQASAYFPAQSEFSVSYSEKSDNSGGEGRVVLRTKGLPAKTSVLLKLKLDGGEIPASWRRYTVSRGGLLNITVGPYQRKLLPGNYTVELSVNRYQQDVTLDEFFGKWSDDIKMAYSWSYRAQEQAEFRGTVRKQLGDLVSSTLEILEECLKTGEGYRNGDQFHRGGRFDKVAFLKWADGVAHRMAANKQKVRGMENSHLAPYWPHLIRFDCPNMFLMLRFLVIDYTIYPIHQRESLGVARRFQPQSGMMFKPNRKSAASKVRSLAREISKILEGAQGGELLTLLPSPTERPAGFSLATLEGNLADLVQTNPGAATKVTSTTVKLLTRSLGVSLSAEDLRGVALLSLRPGDPDGKAETIELYLLHFKREFYGTILSQKLTKQRKLGRWQGRVLQKEDIVAVVSGPSGPPHRGAIRSLANFMANKKKFKETSR